MRITGTGIWRTCLILVAYLSLSTLVAGCGTVLSAPAGGQGVAPTPTSDPNEFELTPVIPEPTTWPSPQVEPQHTRNPDDGVGVDIVGTFAPPPSPEEFAQRYDLIVTGTVVQVLSPRWSTPDGKRPPGITQQDVPNKYLIFTPVIVKLDGAPLVNRVGADESPGVLVVATFGGHIGNDEFSIDAPSHHLQMGQHALFGLTDRPLLMGAGHARYSTPAGTTWNVGMVYTLTNDGKATPGIPDAPAVDAQDYMAAIVKAAAN